MRVDLGLRSYDIHIGAETLPRVGPALARLLPGASRALVAIGMVAAGRLALAQGLWSARWQRELEETLQGLGLPLRIPAGLTVAGLLAAMRADKKVLDGTARWILPVRPGTVTLRSDIEEAKVAAVLAAMGAAEEPAAKVPLAAGSGSGPSGP